MCGQWLVPTGIRSCCGASKLKLANVLHAGYMYLTLLFLIP